MEPNCNHSNCIFWSGGTRQYCSIRILTNEWAEYRRGDKSCPHYQEKEKATPKEVAQKENQLNSSILDAIKSMQNIPGYINYYYSDSLHSIQVAFREFLGVCLMANNTKIYVKDHTEGYKKLWINIADDTEIFCIKKVG